jgi:hypothetical protein
MPLRVIALTLAALLASAAPLWADDVATRLADQYGSPRGYRSIKRDALAWHRTTRNACVAFASTALRHVGVAVPRPGPDGTEAISRLTKPFVEYLEVELGWTRITDVAELQRGDLLFTTDAPCCPGYPSHVVVMLGWRDQARAVVRVVDNGGRDRDRSLAGDAKRDVDAFAFALRPPT